MFIVIFIPSLTMVRYCTVVRDGFFISLTPESLTKRKVGICMMTLDEAKAISKGYDIFPVSKEIMADIKTPIEVLRILKNVSRHCYTKFSLFQLSFFRS